VRCDYQISAFLDVLCLQGLVDGSQQSTDELLHSRDACPLVGWGLQVFEVLFVVLGDDLLKFFLANRCLLPLESDLAWNDALNLSEDVE
jgi:hypothetical protein